MFWLLSLFGLAYLLQTPDYYTRAREMVPQRDPATLRAVVSAAAAAVRGNEIVDLPWLLAVGYVESRWYPSAQSSVACGCWQQIPRFAYPWTDDQRPVSCAQLLDPHFAALVASRQLESMAQRYGLRQALQRYNRGNAWDDDVGAEYYRRVVEAHHRLTGGG